MLTRALQQLAARLPKVLCTCGSTADERSKEATTPAGTAAGFRGQSCALQVAAGSRSTRRHRGHPAGLKLA